MVFFRLNICNFDKHLIAPGKTIFFSKGKWCLPKPAKKWSDASFFTHSKSFFFTDKRKSHVFQVGHMEWIVINTKSLLQQLLSGLIYYCYVQNVFKTDIKIWCYTIFMKLWIMCVPVSFDNYRHVSFTKKWFYYILKKKKIFVPFFVSLFTQLTQE